MNLVHFSASRIEKLEPRSYPPDSREYFKPRGLWVTDMDCADNWKAWCEAEEFGLDRLAVQHTVRLSETANILKMSSARELDLFSNSYECSLSPRLPNRKVIDWPRLAEEYDGIIITPYIWERRLDGPCNVRWYYSWDCASGCIWNLNAIEEFT
jgi:hypothetical protein